VLPAHPPFLSASASADDPPARHRKTQACDIYRISLPRNDQTMRVLLATQPTGTSMEHNANAGASTAIRVYESRGVMGFAENVLLWLS
jgi:hypothetical protein